MKRGLMETVKKVLTDPGRYTQGPDTYGIIKKLRIERCTDIDKDAGGGETKKKARMFAHWGHKPMAICLSTDFPGLPLANQLGILLHEIGHACARGGGEPQADLFIHDTFGIDIEYSPVLEIQSVDADVAKMFERAGNGE